MLRNEPMHKIVVETEDRIYTWEPKYSDPNLNDYLEAMYTMLIGLTFDPQGILEGMKEFAAEKLPYMDPDYQEPKSYNEMYDEIYDDVKKYFEENYIMVKKDDDNKDTNIIESDK